MVQILGAAYMNDEQMECFISQGRTVESAVKNALKKYKGVQKGIWEYDIFSLIGKKFSRQWCEGDYWGEDFPELCFPKPNKAGIVVIAPELYERIKQSPEFRAIVEN